MYICTQVITTTRTNAFCSGENEAVEKTGYSGKSIDIDRIEDSVYNITRTMETPAIKRFVLVPTFKLVKVYQTQLKVTFLLLKQCHLVAQSNEFRICIGHLNKT